MRSPITYPSWDLIVIDKRGIHNVPIDQIAIERRLAGDTTIRLTQWEKHEAFRQLYRRPSGYASGGRAWTEGVDLLKISSATARRAIEEAVVYPDEPVPWALSDLAATA